MPSIAEQHNMETSLVEGKARPLGLQTTIATSLADLERLRPLWSQMPGHPNANIDFYSMVLRGRPDILRPHVILISEDGVPKAMAVGRIEQSRLEVKLGYCSLWKPRVKLLEVALGGLLGDQSGSAAEALVEALRVPLEDGSVEAVHLQQVRTDSEVFQLARRQGGFLARDRLLDPWEHSRMVLPKTAAEMYAMLSRDHRQQLRRKARHLEKEFAGGIAVRCFREPKDLDRMARDVEQVAKTTYQRGLQAGFIDNAETRKRVSLEAEQGWLSMYVLYLRNQPCAYWWGTVCSNTFYSCALGFDSAYKQHSPGTYLVIKVLEDLCERGIGELDFGLGEARYKQQFSNRCWQEVSLYMFAPTWRGAMLNVSRTCAGWLMLGAKGILRRCNATELAKRMWRGRLAQKQPVESLAA